MISLVLVTKWCSAQKQRPEKWFIGEKRGQILKLVYLLVTPAVGISIVPCRHTLSQGVTRRAAPLKKVHLDFWGPLPRTAAGNMYILMLVDSFTKCVDCVPLSSQTAKLTARAAVMEFFVRCGYPFKIFRIRARF